ncbi:thioredoxin fold domain-containing protein [Patescibacteria group bacterium]|nr:thioredoxin fold domain-containing protein [Patescibacteria group bacterium]
MITLIDFFASWCGPCIAMKPVIEQVETTLAGKIIVKKIDVDENQETASKYGISSIPTFLILNESGVELSRKIGGGMSKDQLVSWISQYLNG